MAVLRRAGLVAVAGLLGCLQPGTVPCGDLLCPAGNVCVAARCASPMDVTACEGKQPDDACDAAVGSGSCIDGVCVAAACGNGSTDRGEACDDANRESGDGCRADCGKVELCGDGLLDPAESCDDANGNAVDECDRCVRQTWTATAAVGTGRLATETSLSAPNDVVVDKLGNVFVADNSNHRVLQISSDGVTTVVAGTGVDATDGDGGPATAAALRYPAGLAVDGLGQLYISSDHRVRQVDRDGIIRTIAGNGTTGFSGDGNQATQAQLWYPAGLAVDGLGALYIADSNNERVRRVDVNGVITTVVGGGVGVGEGGPATSVKILPLDVALDSAAESLIVSDFFGCRVRRVVLATGIITTVTGNGTCDFGGDGGPATSATIALPRGVDIDAAGNIYVADDNNGRIRKVDTAGIIRTVAGAVPGVSSDGIPAVTARLLGPQYVAAAANGAFYFSESSGHRVRRVDTGGTITTFAGATSPRFRGDGGFATGAELIYPYGIAIAPDGTIAVSETYEHRVRAIAPDGTIRALAGTGEDGSSGDGGPALAARFDSTYDLAYDQSGNLFIVDNGVHVIRKVAANGTITTVAGNGTQGFSGDNGPATSAQLRFPGGIALDSAGNLFIADTYNSRVRKVSAAGTITTVAGNGTSGTGGDGGQATAAQLNDPSAVALDSAGNLFIGDSYLVRKVALDGTISTIAGSGPVGPVGDGGPATAAILSSVEDLAFDATGNLFIADRGHDRIRRIDTAGVITTIAGTGVEDSLFGDGAAATSAPLWEPQAIAIDATGSVYMTDTEHQVVRKIRADGVIVTVAGLIGPEGVGPRATARLATPAAMVTAGGQTWVAAGGAGVVEMVDATSVRRAIGRYPQTVATGALAYFRDAGFGSVNGVAVDASRGLVYLSETSAHRIHVVSMMGTGIETWTIASLINPTGAPGFADGAASTARLREPQGLFLDDATRTLYIVDTGNHAVRAFDLVTGQLATIVNQNHGLGFAGDGGDAHAALLFRPTGITRCANGDFFVADTGNHRVRRISSGRISTVVGDGIAASSGDGAPARSFPVDSPRGVACDGAGNLFVTSSRVIRILPAADDHVVDGSGPVRTISAITPTGLSSMEARCMTAVEVVESDAASGDATALRFADACSGLLVELRRVARQ